MGALKGNWQHGGVYWEALGGYWEVTGKHWGAVTGSTGDGNWVLRPPGFLSPRLIMNEGAWPKGGRGLEGKVTRGQGCGEKTPLPGRPSAMPPPPPPRRMRPPLPLSQFPQSQTGQTGPARLGNITAPPQELRGGDDNRLPGSLPRPPHSPRGLGGHPGDQGGGVRGGHTAPACPAERSQLPGNGSSPPGRGSQHPPAPPGSPGDRGGAGCRGVSPPPGNWGGGGELPGPLGSMVGGVPLPMVNWGGRGTGLLAGWVPWGPWGG